MAEHSRFFDSLNPLEPDRTYTAEEFTSYFRALITTGIMKGTANMLKVETSGSDMNTTVDTGTAFLIGRQYENDSKLSLTHEVEALGKSRIDRVVLRLVLDMDARYIKAFVKKGVAGTVPVPPPLTRTGDVYEISLAQVKVIGGQTYINVADVTDERGNPDVCPWAGSNILPNFDDVALAELINSIGKPSGIAKLNSDGKAINADGGLVGLTDTGWIDATLAAGWSTEGFGFMQYRKIGNVVYMRANVYRDIGSSSDLIMSSLPSGYKPRDRVFSLSGRTAGLSINSSGKLTAAPGESSATFEFSYITES